MNFENVHYVIFDDFFALKFLTDSHTAKIPLSIGVGCTDMIDLLCPSPSVLARLRIVHLVQIRQHNRLQLL